MIEQLNMLRGMGYYIIIHTARHMKTCEGNVDLIEAKVGKTTRDWLAKYNVQYDELKFGKPNAVLYIDDKACKNNVTEVADLITKQLNCDIINSMPTIKKV